MGNHDKISEREMKLLCDIAEEFLKPGGTILFFCSVLQFKQYFDYFQGSHINIELNPLCIINSPYLYKQKTNKTFMQSMLTLAIVGHKADNNKSWIWNTDDPYYQGFIQGDFLKTHNVIEHYQPPKNKQISKQGNNVVLRYEEKSIFLMKELISRY